jgi:hypothetical protein
MQAADRQHEEIGDVRFMVRRALRHVRADAGAGHHDRDRADGAGFGAEAMANALVAVHDRGLPTDHGQHVPFRANLHAGPAADAVRCVDVWMLCSWSVRPQLAAFGRSPRRCLLPMHATDIPRDQNEEDHPKGDVD